MIPCISNTLFTIIRCIFAWWTWIVLGYSLYYNAKPEFDTNYDTSKCCIQYYPFAFTHWGLAAASAYWLCILYLSLQIKDKNNLSESCCNRVIFYFTRVTFICGFIGSLVITPAYWLLVFDPANFEANGGLKWFIATLNWHGVTTLLMLIEWFLNSLQLRLYMAIFATLYGISYTGVLFIHYTQNWTDSTGNDLYIYKFLDFHTDLKQSLINASLLVAAASILTVLMIMLKRIMMNTCCYKSGNNKFEIWDESREDSLPQPSAPGMASYPGPSHIQLEYV